MGFDALILVIASTLAGGSDLTMTEIDREAELIGKRIAACARAYREEAESLGLAPRLSPRLQ